MPGHKGKALIGAEALDITEFDGADSLYESNGIIRKSELSASELFGAQTFYSTEGSSLCIRAMLYLCAIYAAEKHEKALILAGRNAHKSFIYSLALLDIDVEWFEHGKDSSYLSCSISAEALDKKLTCSSGRVTAVYITSPDYLGNISDIKSISDVCRRHGVLLLVDNAHGAYLKFLSPSLHPIDLGADMCCDSAHKSLPALTGAAYLHVSHTAPALFAQKAKSAMAFFGSTSPSYLILQSLDAVNKYISQGYPERLARITDRISLLKELLRSRGYRLIGDEPAKITLCPKSYGYTGIMLAKLLFDMNIVCEFYDPDFVVLMPSVQTGDDGIERLADALGRIQRAAPLDQCPPPLTIPERVMSAREASMAASEDVPVSESIGRVLASVNLACPPAVPILVCGERIDQCSAAAFSYYGIKQVSVVKN